MAVALTVNPIASTTGLAVTSPQTHVLTLEAHDSARLEFEYEVVAEFESGLFRSPAAIAVTDAGYQYYLDVGDGDVKVLTSDNRHVRSFGGIGQAPGEWLSPEAISISPRGEVLVWDGSLQVLHAFTLRGDYTDRIGYDGRFLSMRHVVWLDDDTALLGGLSWDEGLDGYFVHRMRVHADDDGRRRLLHEASFASVPPAEPGIYRTLSDALLFRDIDGNLVVSMRARYWIRKFTVAGELVWETRSGRDVLPDVSKTLDVTPTGMVRVPPHPQAVSVLGTESWLVHQIWLVPTGLPERGTEPIDPRTMDTSQITIPRIFELIGRLPEPGPVLRFRTEVPLRLHAIDQAGRAYGTLGDWDPIPVRGTLTLHAQTEEQEENEDDP